MHRQTAVLMLCASLLAALALAPSIAAAKNLQAATVCGVNECAPVPDDLLTIRLVESATTSAGPERAEPWYRVRLKFGGGGHGSVELIVLPRGGYLAGLAEAAGASYDWTTIDSRVAALYRRLVRGLEPYPAARLELPQEPRPKLTTAVDPAAAQSEDRGEGSDGLAVAGATASVILLAAGVASFRRRRGRTAS
jgi:hypothetical protein